MVSHTGYNWLIFVKIHDWLVQRSWTLWTPRVPHIHKLFFINFRGVVCACKFISSWQLFAEWTKCHVYTWFRSGDWYCQNKAPEVNSFSRECYQVPPPPPVFEERAWVRGYYYSAIIFTLKSLTFISCGYTVWGYVLMLKLIELSKWQCQYWLLALFVQLVKQFKYQNKLK